MPFCQCTDQRSEGVLWFSLLYKHNELTNPNTDYKEQMKGTLLRPMKEVSIVKDEVRIVLL